MTVNTSDIVDGPYVGNGAADTYDYFFRVDDKSQLTVTEFTDLGVESLLTVDVDYTVNGVGVDAGGTVTRLAGNLPTDYQWIIRADYQLTQLTDFDSQGGFFPDVHESVSDKLTFILQQLKEEIDRCVKVTIVSGDDPDALIASIESTAAASAVSAAASAVSAAAAAADVVLTNADVVLTNADVTYATEWANKAEDSLVSAAAGGDEVDDYSALHHAAKAAVSAATASDIAVAAAGTDTYTAALGISSYTTNKTYFLKIPNTNLTTTPTINFDGLGAKNIKNMNGAALHIGQIPNNPLLQYDGTDMLLLNPISDYPGKIDTCAIDTIPSNALERDGAAYSRTVYAALFAAIGTTYGVGDGSTTFNVPDNQGEFERIWDHAAGVDPDRASRTDRGDGTTGDNVGTKQADQFKSHTHVINTTISSADGLSGIDGGSGAADAALAIPVNSTGGNQTNPINYNAMGIIYY